MSIVLCDGCDSPIDSDDDPDCFIESPRSLLEAILCERCREREADRRQERAAEE